MKLLFIADSTSIHTQRWLDYFIDAGHQVSIITIGRKRQRLAGVRHLDNFETFTYTSADFPMTWLRTRRLVRRWQPQILHGHFIHQYGWLAALSRYRPLVLTAWGTDILNLPYASRSGVGKWLTRYSLRKADLLTATSAYLKAEMVKLGALESKTHVIFWGVDAAKFNPQVDTGDIRRRLDVADHCPLILSNRNQIALYNNDTVIRAMALVLKSFPQAVLVLQNAGGNQEADLRQLAGDLGIVANLRFLPQFPHDRLPPLYAAADIYVSVPTWDAGPVSLKEAMSCGAVPVISAVPGPMEWVQDGVNGMVVPVRDHDLLARAICRLLKRPALLEKYRQINRDIIVERADHCKLMQQMEDLYRGLLQ